MKFFAFVKGGGSCDMQLLCKNYALYKVLWWLSFRNKTKLLKWNDISSLLFKNLTISSLFLFFLSPFPLSLLLLPLSFSLLFSSLYPLPPSISSASHSLESNCSVVNQCYILANMDHKTNISSLQKMLKKHICIN